MKFDLRNAINSISDVVMNRPAPLREFDQIYMKVADMVIQAEYPRKNAQYGHLTASERQATARLWIKKVTGAVLRDEDYRRHLMDFRITVEKEILR